MPISRTAPTGWKAPAPLTVLDWQRRQEAYTRTNLNAQMLAMALESGSWTIMPTAPAPVMDPLALAVRILMITEADRLHQARTYSIGANATGLAVAAAAGSAPQERISTTRPPSPTGLMVFADPIGSDVEHHLTHSGNRVEIHTPIVAVSWSLWDGSQTHILGQEHPLTWIRQSRQRGLIPSPSDQHGIWMTFYAPRTGDTTGVDPNATVSVGPDGTPVTAAESAAAETAFRRRNPEVWGPLAWHNEVVLPEGGTFEPHPEPGTVQHWAATVYTTWQIIQQTGKSQLTETTRTTLPPAARKKAKTKAKTHNTGRSGTTGDGTVRVIDLAAPVRPTSTAAEQDAAASDGRRTVQWSCRWPVPPYRRNTCLNTYLHHKLSDDRLEHHEHREDIVPFTVKGPADKPLRIPGGTTFTFDTPQP
ncbi:hypothetical protein ACFU5O_28245 [Streptomyces sp. NPDC057445]|uniref:hypothetical protein n=1 Tax=Streptomyces sp. NPDC057445 TaxID=3346136 RepID=UPI003680651A